jgi:hypothetical protein
MADWSPDFSGSQTLPAPWGPGPWRAPDALPGSIPEWDPGANTLDLIDRNGTEWDRITIAGVRLMAIADVQGDKDTRIDVKQTPGTDGATQTTLGVSPAPITIRLRFLTPAAVQQWSDLVPSLQPIPGKPPRDPVDVYHPALALNGIKSLYLKTLGTLRVTVPGGPMEVTTRWLEFLPPKKTSTHTALGSSSSGLANTPTAATFQPKKTKPSSNAGP